MRLKLTLRSRDVSNSVRIEIWLRMLLSSTSSFSVFSRSRCSEHNGVYTVVSKGKVYQYISPLGFAAHRWEC